MSFGDLVFWDFFCAPIIVFAMIFTSSGNYHSYCFTMNMEEEFNLYHSQCKILNNCIHVLIKIKKIL